MLFYGKTSVKVQSSCNYCQGYGHCVPFCEKHLFLQFHTVKYTMAAFFDCPAKVVGKSENCLDKTQKEQYCRISGSNVKLEVDWLYLLHKNDR